MGEYATRLSDGQRVKIGTCQSMYYCRYDQRKQIAYGYPTKDCSWRIPAFEEDGIQPGDFGFGELVKDRFPLYSTRLRHYDAKFLEYGLDNNVGIKQVVVDELGLLINLPCYHGLKLPEAEGFKFFWNGKRDALHLQSLTNSDDDLLVGISCMACGRSWNCTFDEVAPYIISLRMLLRLYKQCNEYCQKDGEPYKYKIDKWERREADYDGDNVHTLYLKDEIDEDGKRLWTADVEHRYWRKEDRSASMKSHDFEELKRWLATELKLECEWQYKRH